MEPAVVLEYRPRPDARPRLTGLAVASIILGTFGALASLARFTDAWGYVFDSTFRWNYPPLPWVCPAYLIVVSATAVAYAMLAVAGIISLIKPAAGLLFQLWCAACVLPLVVLMAVLRAMQFLPHPDVSAASLVVGVLIESAVFGVYPAIIVLVVLRSRKRPRSSGEEWTGTKSTCVP